MSSISRSEAMNKVKTLLGKAKRSIECGVALKSKTNPKIFWPHTQEKLKTKPGVAPLLTNSNDKNSLKFDEEEKADILLKQFSSVFNKEHEGTIPRIPRRRENRVGDLHVTEAMVKKELMCLNINKSSGPDKFIPVY